MTIFKGSGVALVTPFIGDEVNYKKIGELIDWHIQEGTDAIVVCGTTGESPTLSKEEKKKVIEFAIEHTNGQIPVIAGTGGNNTKDVIELSRFADEKGADGLLIVTPYYNKSTQKGLIKHYHAIADAVDTPIILYSVAGRTGINIDPETVEALSKHPKIVAIKEASGNIAQIAEIAERVPANFGIYSGNDDQILPLLSLGGIGVISVVANILPKMTHELVMDYLKGSGEASLKKQLKILEVVRGLFIETNPIPVKEAMNLMGWEVGELRAPLYPMEESNRAVLENAMRKIGIDL